MGFREIADWLVPSWITAGDGGAKTLTITAIIDASVEHVRLALEARFPSRAGDDALELIGQDRAIPRGRAETSAHYAGRLKRWRWPRGHRTRGTSYALLEQIGEYFGGVLVRLYARNGRRYTRTPDAVESWAAGAEYSWDGLARAGQWGRFWIAVAPDTREGTSFTAQTDSFAAGLAVGLKNFLPADREAIRNMLYSPHPWKPIGVRGEWLVFALDGFDAAVPDATWEHWSAEVAGVQVPTRYASWRYVSLNPAVNNTYSGDPTKFPQSCNMLSGANKTGNSANFASSVVLPNGTTYYGNPANFAANVLLLDDGDALA